MAISIAAREAGLLQRFPVLRHVPEGQRLFLARQAAKQRAVWGPLLLTLVPLLPVLWLGLSGGQENLARGSLAAIGGLVGGLLVATFMQLFHYRHGKAIQRLVGQ
ncbi:hypothetical protein [Variovorax sp. dw_308]|uniref:hypothetical protein n=1 Tax=Variovorax sp. dw_308 TaxID=2721546 RepID=UPI001C4728C6|nr:hypothetical protein [Variovorax sp. dw_308]